MKTPCIGDTPLVDYRITYNGMHAASAAVAERLQGWLRRACGVSLEALPLVRGEELRSCIRLGARTTGASPYGEGALYAEDGTVFVDGNDVAALAAGASYLVHVLKNADAAVVPFSALSQHFSLQNREEYVHDASAFLPTYRFACSANESELTLERKREVLHDPKQRPFVIAHRCEHVFYPENSLEAAISAWRCGADSAEVDIQRSADGVWMCMHDSDVTRTTNAETFLGTLGFPASPFLCDWTFAQLRALRLKDPYGQLSPFPIPTLEEMLHACDNRIYLHLDKRFCVPEDIFPVMEAQGVYSCVYLCNHVSLCDVPKLNSHFAAQGVRLDNLTRPRGTQTAEELIPEMLAQLPHVTPALIPLGDYVKHGEREHALVKRYGDHIRFGAWFLRDFDHEALWRDAREKGISIFMTDHPMDLIALGL